MNQNPEYIRIILEVISELCPNKRRPKYSNEYYITNILSVLKDVNSWKSLKNLNLVGGRYHYKTIADKFLEWSRNGVFKEAHRRILLRGTFAQYNDASNINLFIDSTHIDNKGGVELIDYAQNKKKKHTKNSVITNKNKQIIAVALFKNSVADPMTIVLCTLNNLNGLRYNQINLMGDKGYVKDVTYKNNLLNTRRVKLIHYYRKNQRVQLNEEEKLQLKDRYKVEHSIQQLKKYNRISLRKDKLKITYESFVYLALCILSYQL